MIFTTHGNSNDLVFADGERSTSKLKAALLTLSSAKRKKLRAVFSTACFGATHRDAWIAGGFKRGVGLRGHLRRLGGLLRPVLVGLGE